MFLERIGVMRLPILVSGTAAPPEESSTSSMATNPAASYSG